MLYNIDMGVDEVDNASNVDNVDDVEIKVFLCIL